MNYKDLLCIKMTHHHTNGTITTKNISFNIFEEKFVNERWEDEKRTQKVYSIFGLHHSKTTVNEPYSRRKSIRFFDFPMEIEEARTRHNQYIKEIENA